MTGQTVSHYRITEKIGGGGMGVVYRAEDTRLGRQVALKFLPEDIASDPLALDRFRREARAASAINHPHICTVYDIGEDEQKRPFLAMEYLEGETLKSRIESGPVLFRNVVDWSLQIADALEAAHSKGIVHRDVKPANLFVTTRSQIKVLDFGLAKLATEKARMGASEATATVSVAFETSPGTTMGTISYMSPEQAGGDDLDARTDIFSFGVVVYQMATGKLPFEGRTTALVFNAILSQDPDPPSIVNPELPPEFDRIVMRMLEKDRAMRYQSASDLGADLRRLQRDTTTAISLPSVVRKPAQAKGALRRMWLLAIPTLLIAAGAVGFVLYRARSGAAPARRHELRRITANPAERPVSGAFISPDGQFIAYSDPTGIHLFNLRSANNRLLAKTTGMTVWGWAPGGGKLLAMLQQLDTFPEQYAIDVMGGVDLQRIESWGLPSPDGSRTLSWKDRGEVFVEDPTKGTSRSLLGNEARRARRPMRPSWSPDGTRIAFLRPSRPGPDRRPGESWIVWQDAATGRNVDAVGPIQGPVGSLTFAGNNRILFTLEVSPNPEINAGVYQADLDSEGLSRTPPVLLAPADGFDYTYPSASSDGRNISMIRVLVQSDVYVGEIGPRGLLASEPQRFTIDDRNDRPEGWTADSKSILFSSDRNGNYDIFRQTLGSDNAELLVGGTDRQTSPKLSPDGKFVLYTSREDKPGSHPRIMRVPVNGGTPTLVAEVPGFAILRCYSGGCIVEQTKEAERIVSRLDPDTGKGPEVFRRPRAGGDITVSPDGKLLAHFAEGGVIRILDMEGRSQRDIRVKGVRMLNALDWAPNGRGFYSGAELVNSGAALVYIDLDGQSTVLWTQPGAQQIWGVPSPNGKYLAILGATRDSNVWLLENQ